MKLRKTALAAAFAGALGGSAGAHALTIDGITFEAGAIFETIDLFEAEAFGDGLGNDNGLIDLPGEQLVGIGIVNRIRSNDIANGNPVLWENGDNGRELTIYFYDYIAEDLNALGGVDFQANFTGGVVRLFSDSAMDFLPTASQAGGIATATNGNLWLELTGSPIGDAGLPGGEFGSISGDPVTLRSIGPLSSGSVAGFGLLDVTGNGLAAANFDTDLFNCNPAGAGSPCPDDADKVLTSSGQLGAGNDPSKGVGWAFFGTGEVQDNAIPVPTTLALLGLGLAGMGFSSRRKARS